MSPQKALDVATKFITRAEIRREFGDMLDDWLESAKISTQDHRKANELLAALASLSLPRSVDDPKPPEPPSKNPPDATL